VSRLFTLFTVSPEAKSCDLNGKPASLVVGWDLSPEFLKQTDLCLQDCSGKSSETLGRDLQLQFPEFSTLSMEAVFSSETLLNFCRISGRHIAVGNSKVKF
jgi:hypothetical protein